MMTWQYVGGRTAVRWKSTALMTCCIGETELEREWGLGTGLFSEETLYCTAITNGT